MYVLQLTSIEQFKFKNYTVRFGSQLSFDNQRVRPNSMSKMLECIETTLSEDSLRTIFVESAILIVPMPFIMVVEISNSFSGKSHI